MSATPAFRIAVLPGDGIGPEVIAPTVELIEAAAACCGFGLHFDWLDAGADTFRATGSALPAATLRACGAADAVLLGAMGLPSVRRADGTEVAPQLDLRFEYGLIAGLRPIRAIPGVWNPLRSPQAGAIDLVIVRESTEGLFASRGKGTIEDDREARDTMVITRPVCERLFDIAFDLARGRGSEKAVRRVTCVDKANVFTSMAFFRRIFDERASAFPDVAADHAYVDATALALVLRPWEFDVLVTENMFGDILSDLAAGLIGGMGYAPSADLGEEHGVFQPAHGSAPDIAGSGLANPTAAFLSGAMMLEWLADRQDLPAAAAAAQLIRDAVDEAFRHGTLRTCELGGSAGTAEVAAVDNK